MYNHHGCLQEWLFCSFSLIFQVFYSFAKCVTVQTLLPPMRWEPLRGLWCHRHCIPKMHNLVSQTSTTASTVLSADTADARIKPRILTIITIVLEMPADCRKIRTIGERAKSLCVHAITVYWENPRKWAKTLLEKKKINKINCSIAFLYTNHSK